MTGLYIPFDEEKICICSRTVRKRILEDQLDLLLRLYHDLHSLIGKVHHSLKPWITDLALFGSIWHPEIGVWRGKKGAKAQILSKCPQIICPGVIVRHRRKIFVHNLFHNFCSLLIQNHTSNKLQIFLHFQEVCWFLSLNSSLVLHL